MPAPSAFRYAMVGKGDAAMFTADGEVVQPSEVLYKKPILVERGSFRPATKLTRHDGTIDKFLGDGMMVLFGAPLDDPYQEEHAVLAAVEMQKELRALCISVTVILKPFFRIFRGTSG